MFQLKKERIRDQIALGIFGPTIPYEVRLPSADWSEWFGEYQNQRWGLWDSNSCWCLSSVNSLEDQLEWLWGNNMFNDEAKDFFNKNGYRDADGDFSISEQFLEILGGHLDAGGAVSEAWTLMEIYGCIPRKTLDYTLEKAGSFKTKAEFNADYFNKNRITPEMKELGKQFKKYVKIQHQRIGNAWETPEDQIIDAALRQAPVIISIPVPKPSGRWNNPVVIYDGGKNTDHAVELYARDKATGYRKIFDQYEPHLKLLPPNYYLASVIQGVVTAIPQASPNPIKQKWIDNIVWQSVFEWFNMRPPAWG